MDFARQMVEFLPEKISSSMSEYILEVTQEYIDHSATDFFFSFCKPSVIGASCLASTLTGSDILSISERQAFWLELARITDMIEVVEAQDKLLAGKAPTKPVTSLSAARKSSVDPKAAAFYQPKTPIASITSSPVCMTQTARQA
mmetsp:Transcript_30239/g.51529  ORF Transcript_30239/g.51529 Transcript_30239/m.51529 type:complete len:144 (+) Transcript_30239:1-432(+)